MATAVTYKSGAVVTFNLKKLANDFNDLVSHKSIDDDASALSLQKQTI